MTTKIELETEARDNIAKITEENKYRCVNCKKTYTKRDCRYKCDNGTYCLLIDNDQKVTVTETIDGTKNICEGCEHENGWCMKDTIVIDSVLSNDDLEAECTCNNIGCGAKKTFKFDVVNVREVKK